MRAFVLDDETLGRQAGRFVWLAIDTDHPVNAPFVDRFTVDALPSFLVIDPATETPVLRFVGGATLGQMLQILDDGERAIGPMPAGGVERLLRDADLLNGRAKSAEAAQAYQQALAQAPPDWPAYRRAAESLVLALQIADDPGGCARAAQQHYPKLGRSPSAGNVAATGLFCAVELPDDDAEAGSLRSSLEQACQSVVADAGVEMADDDRSGVYMALIEARDKAKDAEGARRLRLSWAEFLEKAASAAADAEGRAVFDSHRLTAYLALGEPARAIPMLEASERDLPWDYNPSRRLAVAYKELKRYDDALAATDRGLPKVSGASKVRLLSTRADIYEAQGDKATARTTIEQAIREAETLPATARNEEQIKRLKGRLEKLGTK